MVQNSINAEENPIFGSIDIYPSKPAPHSNVSFTIGINSNVTVEDIRLIVQECKSGMCLRNDSNVSMNYSHSCCMAFYETQIKLIYEGATTIKYYVKILSNGTWYTSDTSFTDLSIPGNNNRSTPGFELVLIIFSIILFLTLKKRNL